MTTAAPAISNIQVLDRAVSLLNALSAMEREATLKELAESTGLHRSTTCRILDALQRHGYVERVAVGLYRLGERVRTNDLRMVPVEELAMPVLARLRDAVGETVSLVQFTNATIQFVRSLTGKLDDAIVIELGARLPLHATAAGKLFLGSLGADAIHDYAQRQGLAARTPHTVCEISRLIDDARRARKRGYGLECDEAQQDAASIAALIFDARGTVAGLCIHAPSARVQRKWHTLLQAHALLFSQQLLSRPPPLYPALG